MKILVVVLVMIQVSCFAFGTFQGLRYIKADPFSKAGPWLLVAIALWPLITVLQ